MFGKVACSSKEWKVFHSRSENNRPHPGRILERILSGGRELFQRKKHFFKSSVNLSCLEQAWHYRRLILAKVPLLDSTHEGLSGRGLLVAIRMTGRLVDKLSGCGVDHLKGYGVRWIRFDQGYGGVRWARIAGSTERRTTARWRGRISSSYIVNDGFQISTKVLALIAGKD